jgi:NAD(P)-dependent dehydrogenase (short-subunit alcohol dehydrogenase family)
MNRTILITGANNGIGLALTRSLLDMGDRVAAFDLSLENLAQATPNLLPFVCDVTDPQRVQFVVDEVTRQWGGVDILINNACLALFTPFDERTLDYIRREFDVNYFGYLNLIRAVLPGMKKQGHGVAQGIVFNVMHPPLTRKKSAAGFGVPPGMMADLRTVGYELAKLIGKTRPMLAAGFVNNLQLWMSYHLRVPKGRLLSSLAEKARKAQEENTIVTSARQN